MSSSIALHAALGDPRNRYADAKLLGELATAVEVSFQHPDTDDAWVAPLKGLKNLKKQHLEKSKITDKALDTVGAIGSLEYLNLYKTGVTDAGLDKLSGLKNLKPSTCGRPK